MYATSVVPERSRQQRLDALAAGNAIRSHRAQLKRDLKAGRVVVLDVLIDPDARLESMKVFDLLRAVPSFGKVKVGTVLRRNEISPSKTVGGLSKRQRLALVMALSR